MADEAGLQARAFLEQLVMTMRVMEAIFVFWVKDFQQSETEQRGASKN